MRGSRHDALWYRSAPARSGPLPRGSVHSDTSHSFNVLSALPESAKRPSGEKATEVTVPLCPVSSCSSVPVAATQSVSEPFVQT